jgi:hypothetical protein
VLPSSLGLLVGLGLVLTSPLSAALLVAGCVATLIVVKSNHTNELLVLAFLVLSSTTLEQFNVALPTGLGTIYVTDILLWGSLGRLSLRALARPRATIVRTPLDVPLVMFCGVAMLSTCMSILQDTSTLKESLGPIRAVANYLVYFLVTHTIREDRQLKTLWTGMLLLGLLTAIAMCAQYVVGDSTTLLAGRVEVLDTEGTTFRGVTRMIPPGESLVFLCFIVAMVSAALERLSLVTGLRLLQWGVLAAGMVLTFKRHLFVAVALLFMMLVYVGRARDRARIVVLAAVVAAVTIATTLTLVAASPGSRWVGLSSAILYRVSTLVDGNTYDDPHSSLRWRDFEYRYALPQVISNPLIGVGLATTYRPFVAGRDWLPDGDYRRFVHNGHIALILRSGLVGYFCFMWLSATFVLRGLKYWRVVPAAGYQPLVLGLALAHIGVMVGSIVSPIVMNAGWTAVLGVAFATNESIYILCHSSRVSPRFISGQRSPA